MTNFVNFDNAKETEEGYLVAAGEGALGVKDHALFSNYQLDEYKFAISKCTRFRRALDLGANYGIMTLRMAENFQTVEAFEPLFHEFLAHNTKNTGVNIHPYALGDEEKEVTMRVGLFNAGGSNVVADDNDKYKELQTVEMKTLDSFKFTDVDFIKMDIENHEWIAMQGAFETMKQCNVFMIEINKDHKHKDEIHEYFKERGFKSEKFVRDTIFWKSK